MFVSHKGKDNFKTKTLEKQKNQNISFNLSKQNLSFMVQTYFQTSSGMRNLTECYKLAMLFFYFIFAK